MATITLNIPNPVINRVVDAFAIKYNYQPTVTAQDGITIIPNPQTKADFAKEQIAKNIKQIVKEQEGQAAAILAINAANNNVESNIIIT